MNQSKMPITKKEIKDELLGSQQLIKMNHKYTCILMTFNDINKMHKSCAIKTLFTYQTVNSFKITKVGPLVGGKKIAIFIYFFN
jgi:ABC-type metal ion transport system substrate-binding protein